MSNSSKSLTNLWSRVGEDWGTVITELILALLVYPL